MMGGSKKRGGQEKKGGAYLSKILKIPIFTPLGEYYIGFTLVLTVFFHRFSCVFVQYYCVFCCDFKTTKSENPTRRA